MKRTLSEAGGSTDVVARHLTTSEAVMTLAAVGATITFIDWLRRDPESKTTKVAEWCIETLNRTDHSWPEPTGDKMRDSFMQWRALVGMFKETRSLNELLDLVDAWIAYTQVAHLQFSPDQKA
jgi:hypothetical protein